MRSLLLASTVAAVATAAAASPTHVEIAPGVMMPFVSDGIILDTNATHPRGERETAGLEKFLALGGPSGPKPLSAARPVRRALLTPPATPGSRCRCGRSS